MLSTPSGESKEIISLPFKYLLAEVFTKNKCSAKLCCMYCGMRNEKQVEVVVMKPSSQLHSDCSSIPHALPRLPRQRVLDGTVTTSLRERERVAGASVCGGCVCVCVWCYCCCWSWKNLSRSIGWKERAKKEAVGKVQMRERCVMEQEPGSCRNSRGRISLCWSRAQSSTEVEGKSIRKP